MSDRILYSPDHLWVRILGERARIGITPQKVERFEEVTYIELPDEGDSIEKGEPFGEVETGEEVFELVAPVTGVVVNVNEEIIEEPELLLDDPVEDGWLLEVSIEDPTELDEFLTEEEYEALSEEELEREEEE